MASVKASASIQVTLMRNVWADGVGRALAARCTTCQASHVASLGDGCAGIDRLHCCPCYGGTGRRKKIAPTSRQNYGHRKANREIDDVLSAAGFNASIQTIWIIARDRLVAYQRIKVHPSSLSLRIPIYPPLQIGIIKPVEVIIH